MPKHKKKEDPLQDERYNEIAFQWQFSDREEYHGKRGKTWYIVAAIIIILFSIYSLFTFNFLFMVIIILTAFIIYIDHIREEQEIQFTVADTGILVDKKFYPWKDIKNFYIIYEPPEVKNIYIEFHSFIKPLLVIPLQSQDPVKIRAYLRQFLLEDLEKEEEPVTHTLGRQLKL